MLRKELALFLQSRPFDMSVKGMPLQYGGVPEVLT